MAPNLCSTFQKKTILFLEKVHGNSIFPVVWKKEDEYEDITSRKSNSKYKVLTKLTFTVSLHQQLKINPGQNLVHGDDMFYMADRILHRL